MSLFISHLFCTCLESEAVLSVEQGDPLAQDRVPAELQALAVVRHGGLEDLDGVGAVAGGLALGRGGRGLAHMEGQKDKGRKTVNMEHGD